MSKGKWLFRKSEAVRAVAAVKATGADVESLKIAPDGTITVQIAKSKDGAVAATNEWDADAA